MQNSLVIQNKIVWNYFESFVFHPLGQSLGMRFLDWEFRRTHVMHLTKLTPKNIVSSKEKIKFDMQVFFLWAIDEKKVFEL